MPDLKTLKVCLSSELPLITERDPNTIYFLYDKLLVFLGQSLYNDPYAIVEAIPENPVFNMLYFDLSDGKVKAYIDYSVTEIAEVETPEQLEILKQSGTTFFVNSEKRYLDLRRRTVTLPYQNGTYMLTVDLANNLKFDENTVLGFNPETNCFEVIGKYDDFDMVFTRRYRDLDTHTVDTHVSEHKISADIKVSKMEGNVLRIHTDGLYASSGDKVTKDRFDSLLKSFRDYRTDMEEYLNNLAERIGMEQGKGTLAERIDTALQKVYPEIDEALANYEEFAQKFDGLEERLTGYVDQRFVDTQQNILELYGEFLDNPWDTFGTYPEEPTDPEPDPGEETDPTEPEIPDPGAGEEEETSPTNPETPETGESSTGTEENPDTSENTDSSTVEEPETDTTEQVNSKEEQITSK